MYEGEILTTKNYQDINPVIFGYDTCESSHHYGPAVRTYWLLHFVVSGKGFFRIENREYTLRAGEIFVIPPYTEAYYEADAESPWEYIWIGFVTNTALPAQLNDVMTLQKAGHIFKSMKAAQDMSSGKTEFLCAKLWELFSAILENNETNLDYIETSLNIIHAEYMLGITVQELADRLNLERTYFSHIFKKSVGVSPKKYLLNYRMKRAADLILNYGQSISTTALSVGYNDIYVFSKMFKQFYGVSPTQCRELDVAKIASLETLQHE